MPSVERVGLIGDVHCEDAALAFVLAQLSQLDAGPVLQVGDIVDGPGDLEATVRLLRQYAVIAVRGNHERWLLEGRMRELPDATPTSSVSPDTRAYLQDLPVTLELSSPRGNVLLCHGLGENDLRGVKPEHQGYDLSANDELQRLIAEQRFRYVLNGHTHRPLLRQFGSLTVVNAGTLLRKDGRCFTLIDFARGELRRWSHPGPELCTELGAWTLHAEALPTV